MNASLLDIANFRDAKSAEYLEFCSKSFFYPTTPFLLFTFTLSIILLGMAQAAQAANSDALNFAAPVDANSGSSSQTASLSDSSGTASDSSDPALSFALIETPVPAPPAPPPAKPPVVVSSSLFAGGSNSLVARTVGHAEGTRTAEGGKTWAYYGHVDPGNGVWNLGSFSFQHCSETNYACSTPEEADQRQLDRLRRQVQQLRDRARRVGLKMTLEEELNGIDLANQAPLAALGMPGYVEWLQQAHQRGLRGSEAVLWARVSAYWDPRRRGWDAPGLGNSEVNITHDQNRRLMAITRALERYQQQLARQEQQIAAMREERADQLIAMDLSRN